MGATQRHNPKQPPTPPAPPTEARVITIVTLVIALLTAAACTAAVWAEPRPIGDLFVAFASGRDILEGKLAKPDEWAFTTTGRVWFNQNYGTHLLHYLGYLWGGEWGVLGMKLFFVAATTTFVALAARQRGASWAAALIAAGGAIAASRSYVDMRPNLTTLTFAPLVLWIFYLSRTRVHVIWLAVVIEGLWANAHGGFIFGVGMILLWAGMRFLMLVFSVGPREALRKGWPLPVAAIVTVLLATFVNPFGIENLLFPFTIIAPAWKKLNEWQPMFPDHPTGFGTTWEFFVVTGVLAGLTVLRAFHYLFSGKQSREDFSVEKVGMFLFDAALACTLVVMSYKARRFIPLTVILLGPLVAMQLDWLARTPGWRWLFAAGLPPATGAVICWYFQDYHWLRIFDFILVPLVGSVVLTRLADLLSGRLMASKVLQAAVLPLAAVALLLPVGYYAWREYLYYRPDNPLFPRENVFSRMNGVLYMPTGAAQFIRDNDISGRVLNEWRWEGYLRWMCPKVKVFLGGRAHQVYREETDTLVTKILWYPKEARQLLAEQDVHLIVIPAEDKYVPLLSALIGSQWAQLYFDGKDTVLADGQWPQTLDLIRRCADGKLVFPDETAAALSRAACMTAFVLKCPADAVLQAIIGANRLMPLPVNYEAVWRIPTHTPDSLQWVKAYFESEAARLRAMDMERADGLRALYCRKAVADCLARVCRELMNISEMVRWQKEVEAIQGDIKAMRKRWELH